MALAPRSPSIPRKSDRTKPPANGSCSGSGSGSGGGAGGTGGNGGSGGTDGQNSTTPNTNFEANSQEGKAAAEQYLGRPLSDQEYNELVAATYAEAGSNQQERAYVAGTILNRARTTGLSVGEVLRQPWQFQAVTGTKNNPNPSSGFVNGPNSQNENLINGAFTNYLSDVPTNNYYFDAANPNAYGPGTTMPTNRDGVAPITVGESRFYPGADWP